MLSAVFSFALTSSFITELKRIASDGDVAVTVTYTKSGAPYLKFRMHFNDDIYRSGAFAVWIVSTTLYVYNTKRGTSYKFSQIFGSKLYLDVYDSLAGERRVFLITQKEYDELALPAVYYSLGLYTLEEAFYLVSEGMYGVKSWSK